MSVFKEYFTGKRILVTGAGKGLGRALTVKLHELGAVVFALSRTKSDLDSLQQECPNIISILVDISDWDGTREALNQVLSEPVDVVVNNAAVSAQETFMTITNESFDNMININLKAVVNISQVCASKMIEAKVGGTIINISSLYSISPTKFAPTYSATKAAMDSFTKTMAAELGQHKIRVVAINPGLMDTPMLTKNTGNNRAAYEAALRPIMPLGEIYVPLDEIVNGILFMASGMVKMATGSGFVIDGGYLTH